MEAAARQQATQEYAGYGQSDESLMDQITSDISMIRKPIGNYAHDVAVETGESLGIETVRSMRSGEDYPNPETIAKSAASVELVNHTEDEIARQVSKDLPPYERHDAEERALGFALIRGGSSGNLLSRIRNNWNDGLDSMEKRMNEFLTNPDGSQDKEAKSNDLKEKRRVVEENYYDYGPREKPSIKGKII
ncbi:MAG: hypothetical protein Q6358_14820, partial [Candidatus Brocadiales bacterium]|nr:hypothetical protein [Candidatus Brocadiales bacterium]